MELTALPEISSRIDINKRCENSEANFNWFVEKLPGTHNEVDVQADTSNIHLGKYIKTSGDYKIMLAAKIEDEICVDKMFVRVLRPQVKVQIAGGQQKQHQRTTSLNMEATASDPENTTSVFSYSWVCYTTSSLLTAQLYTHPTADRSSLNKCSGFSKSSSTFQLDTSGFGSGEVALFEVNVATGGNRSAKSVQIVEMMNAEPPDLSLRWESEVAGI